MNRHISEQYDAELESVRLRLMEMGGLVERQLESAARAFVTHDENLAAEVSERDEQVNKLEVGLDDQAIHIIARRQPTAGDLRLLVSIMKTSTDLERIGDEADRIAKMAIGVAALEVPANQYAEVQRMIGLVTKMLTNALDAFARLDVDAAQEVIAADEAVNDSYDEILELQRHALIEHPTQAERAISTIWVARALERIGDHAKNISEYIVYLVRGTDVRHAGASDA